MAKRTRIIEGTWNCSSCDTKGIPGRHKVCPSCGNPRENDAESKFDFGPTTASGRSERGGVDDDEAKDLAAAGADWHCGNCGSANRGDATGCTSCSSPRSEAKPKPPPPPPPEKPRRKGNPVIGCFIFLALLGCCGFCLVGGWWGAQTHTYDGTVSAMAWKRAITRETFTRVTQSGWRDDLVVKPAVMPVAGVGGSPGVEDVRDCVRAQKTTRQVPDGTERVCRTKTRKVKSGTEEKCTKKDLGNGFAEETCEDVPVYRDEKYEECNDETRYRSEPVYGEKCNYTTWEWKAAGAPVEASGNDASPKAPAVTIGPLDRVTATEAYSITWSWTQDGQVKTHTEEPKTEAEFKQWRPGQPVELEVSNVGDVKSKKPK